MPDCYALIVDADEKDVEGLPIWRMYRSLYGSYLWYLMRKDIDDSLPKDPDFIEVFFAFQPTEEETALIKKKYFNARHTILEWAL